MLWQYMVKKKKKAQENKVLGIHGALLVIRLRVWN